MYQYCGVVHHPLSLITPVSGMVRLGGVTAGSSYIIVLYSDVGRKLSINDYYNFIFLAYTNSCSVTKLT